MRTNLHYLEMIDTLSFTAIDFETANRNRNSACSVGFVKVLNGQVVDRGYTLIRPKDSTVDAANHSVHGISEEDLADAPNFADVWKLLEPHITNQVVVAHNCAFDIDILISMSDDNGIVLPDFRYMCSHKLAQEAFSDLRDYRLDDIAAYLKIDFSHHNALSDAEACASVTIQALQKVDFDFTYNHPELTYHISKRASETKKDRSASGLHAKKKFSSELLQPNLESADQGHLLYNKKVVFTGDLRSLSRKEAAEKVHALGADINTAISKKTDYVIMGEKAGPSKVKKIGDLQLSGCAIKIIYEPEFLELLK